MADFFAFSNDLLCVADARGYFIRVNPAWTATLGWSPEELTARPYVAFVHPDDRARTEAESSRLVHDHLETMRFANRYQCRDGTYKWLSWMAIFDEHEQQIIASARDVTEQMDLTEALKTRSETIRQLLTLQEQERKLLSHDIHDGLTQLIVGASMQLEATRHLVGESVSPLEQAIKLVHRAIDEARRLINDLRPMVLDEQGVRDSLENLIAEFRRFSQCQFTLTCKLDFQRTDRLLEGVVLRIVQESVANALRHGKAARIRIEVVQEGAALRLRIEDDGQGFDPLQIPPDRFGVRGIIERAQLFGGDAQFISRPGAGCTVEVRLTIPEPSPFLAKAEEFAGN